MTSFDQRLADIKRFYDLLDRLEGKVGGKRMLASCHGRMNWPRRGVYFFFEPGEVRTTSGTGLRVVRVGTHALKTGSKATLWHRLCTHRGVVGGRHPGGGNHRGSIFRLHVGTALIQRDNWPLSIAGKWGVSPNAPEHIREQEYLLEQAVSKHTGKMPFLWLEVDDPPGPASLRGYIERNAIALLSNYPDNDQTNDIPFQRIDPQSPGWLGHYARSDEIRRSGLWNVDHVTVEYDPDFLDVLEKFI